MKRAAVIRQNNGMDKREALVVAHQIDVLIRKMYLASVSFIIPSRTEASVTP